ncbi:reverse transcriptase domain-containing protein [Tanacetum coccineum]|uniref:Reverse transcriptase domain-containing protein n=1 Tax=Tanacetum coccineum TaxID=301880 RepID=A0ABQ4YQK9_9ASTR
MSINEQTPLSQPTSVVRNALGKEPEKAQQEKLKAVKARLNFEETLRHSESGTPIRRRDLKERLGPRYVRGRSGSPEPRRGRSESPKKKGFGKENGVQNVGKRPRGSLKDFQSAAKTERWAMPTWCHMFNSTLTGNARVWFDDLPKETIDSYDDLKKAFLENYLQQKKCIQDPVEIHNIMQRDRESTEEFVRRYNLECRDVKGAPECMKISGFMHGITNPELIKRLHDKILKSVDEMMRKGETAGKDKAMAILMVQPWERVSRQRITQSFSPNLEILFPPLGEDEGMEGLLIIEAEIGSHCVHRMYVDDRPASEILYEHYFSRLRLEIKKQLIPATTPLIGFNGEIIWSIGQIQLLVTIGDEEHSTSALMNFVVVRSPSSYNGIIGRPGVRKLQAVSSTVYEMLKIPVGGGVITLKSSRLVPLECAMVSGPERTLPVNKSTVEERIKVTINPEYPEHTIMIGSTLTEEGHNPKADRGALFKCAKGMLSD